jgi:hypothetical protein
MDQEEIYDISRLENIEENYPDIPLDFIEKVLRMAKTLSMTRIELHSFLALMQKIEYENIRYLHQTPIKKPSS